MIVKVSVLVQKSKKTGVDVDYQVIRELMKDNCSEDRYQILEQILTQED